ncbi:MAG: VOC family protein [Ferruginibacter sp.]
MNLNQITIPVINVAHAIAFYEKLGLKLIVKSLPDYARFICPNGTSSFSLHVTNQLPTGNGIWIYFEIENLDEYVQSLIEKGIVFEELPDNKPWLWRESRLKDPDNNQLILYYAGTNRTNPAWKFKNIQFKQ